VLATLSSAGAATPGDLPVKHVIVLYPESDGRPGNVRFATGLQSVFAESRDFVVEIYNEYLDATRFPGDVYRHEYAAYLKHKYQKIKVDLIITPMLPSLDFMMKYREECFPGIPVVHAAVEERELEVLKPGTGFVGRPMRFDLVGTLELALKLQPGAKHVYAIFGNSHFDRTWQARATREFERYTERLSFTYLKGLSLNELAAAARDFPAGSIVYYFHEFSDRYGTSYTPALFLEQLAAQINHPLYGHVGTYLGRGLVGGRLMRFETEGESAARLAFTVLNGGDLEQLRGMPPSENTATVDWRQLKRWGLDEANLPLGTIVSFKQPTLWDTYGWYVIGTAMFCALQAALISTLLVQRMRLHRAELRFRESLELAPNARALVNSDGRMVLVNAELEKLFGYDRSELVGQELEILLSRHQPAEHPQGRFALRSDQARWVEGECYGRKKDGSEVPIDVKVNPVFVERRRQFLVSILDESERIRFENALRERNLELASLTGRLIRAQETERRRIARELHDDLNQNLGLVSVELDLLTRQSEDLAPHVEGKLSAISDRVKQVSSSVHELSRQLHPARIEQLGLSVSLRSLCLELGKIHDVAIEYAEQDVPRQLPAEVSLCLYRITQEGLRNIIKHSQAEHASVELHYEEQEIRLLIRDNGIGFDPKSDSSCTGLGLVSMRERARLVNGSLLIDTLPGHGMQLKVRIPLLEEDAAPEGQGIAESAGLDARIVA